MIKSQGITFRDAEHQEESLGRKRAMLEDRDRVYYAATELVAAIDKAGPVALQAANLMLHDDSDDYAQRGSDRILFKKLAKLVKEVA